MKKHIAKLISIILCLVLSVSAAVPAFAADFESGINLSDIMSIISGDDSDTGSFNFTKWFWNKINDDVTSESAIDKWVENIKKVFNGEDPRTDLNDDTPVKITGVDAENAAELFNLTANELKSGADYSVKRNLTESLSMSNIKELGEKSVFIQAMLSAYYNNKDLAASLINAADGKDVTNTEEKKLNLGFDKNAEISVKGQDYVSKIDPADIASVTMEVNTKNRYTFNIQFKNFNSTQVSSFSRLADLPDTSNNRYLTFMGTFLAFKYSNCYAQISVDKNMNVSSYVWGYTLSPLFKWSDGQYSSMAPGLEMDTSDIQYVITEEYSNFNWYQRTAGDADGSHSLTAADARLILRISAGLESYDKSLTPYFDLDGNGVVNSIDARIALRVSSKLDTLDTSKVKAPTEKVLYSRPDSEKTKISDLKVLIIAYQSAQTEEEKSKIEKEMEEKLSADDEQNETTTKAETTTKLRTGTDKANDVINIITDAGKIIGNIIGKK